MCFPNLGDDDAGLKALIDLAESCPKFLRPELDKLFAACIKVIFCTKVPNTTSGNLIFRKNFFRHQNKPFYCKDRWFSSFNFAQNIFMNVSKNVPLRTIFDMTDTIGNDTVLQ